MLPDPGLESSFHSLFLPSFTSPPSSSSFQSSISFTIPSTHSFPFSSSLFNDLISHAQGCIVTPTSHPLTTHLYGISLSSTQTTLPLHPQPKPTSTKPSQIQPFSNQPSMFFMVYYTRVQINRSSTVTEFREAAMISHHTCVPTLQTCRCMYSLVPFPALPTSPHSPM